MEIKTEPTSVYYVGDKRFLDKDEALDYEKHLNDLLDMRYFDVMHNPDLTEGRGYQFTTSFAVRDNYCAEQTVMQYCVEHFGKPLGFVMGVAPMPNWIIAGPAHFTNLEALGAYLNGTVHEGIGDYCKTVPRKVLVLDKTGTEKDKLIWPDN